MYQRLFLVLHISNIWHDLSTIFMNSILIETNCPSFFPIQVNCAVEMKRIFPHVTVLGYGDRSNHCHSIQSMFNFSNIPEICPIFWEKSIMIYPWLWPNICIFFVKFHSPEETFSYVCVYVSPYLDSKGSQYQY